MINIRRVVCFILISLFNNNVDVICFNASSREIGNKISYFKLQGENGIIKMDKVFKNGRYYFFVVFAKGCFYCNKNFPILNRISRIKKINFFGIVLSKKDIEKAGNTRKINFRLYYPVKRNNFMKFLNKTTDNFILFIGDKIIFQKTDVLNLEDYLIIKQIVNENLFRE